MNNPVDAAELPQFFSRACIPQPYGMVASPGEEGLAVGGKGRSPDAPEEAVARGTVADEATRLLAQGQVEEAHVAILVADDNRRAVRSVRQTMQVGIDSKPPQRPSRGGVPEGQAHARHAGKGLAVGRQGKRAKPFLMPKAHRAEAGHGSGWQSVAVPVGARSHSGFAFPALGSFGLPRDGLRGWFVEWRDEAPLDGPTNAGGQEGKDEQARRSAPELVQQHGGDPFAYEVGDLSRDQRAKAQSGGDRGNRLQSVLQEDCRHDFSGGTGCGS